MTASNIFRLSNIYFGLATVAAAGAVAYGIFQFQILQAENKAMSDNQTRMSQIESETKKENAEYIVFVEDRAKKQIELARKIAKILPLDENHFELTRLFDDFFADNDKPGNPIFQSSLRFGKGAPVAAMPEVSTISLSMNLEGTRDNFFKFLKFVTDSGSLETGTRLMNIDNVQLNFADGGELVDSKTQDINFTVDMNAYYQTPKVSR